MDLKTCNNCFSTINSKVRHCPICGKNQKSNMIFIVVGVIIGLIVLCCLVVIGSSANQDPSTQAVTITASAITTQAQASTATATPYPTLTLAPVFPTPTGEEWVKLTVVPLIYAKSNTCLIFDANSLKLCGGKTIDVYVTHGYWHIAWVNPDNTITYTEITPGKVVTVTIPVEALDVYFGNQRP